MKIVRYVCDVVDCQRDAVTRLTAAKLPNGAVQTGIGYVELPWPGVSLGMDLCETHFDRAELSNGSIVVRIVDQAA